MGRLRIEGGLLKGYYINFHDVKGLRPLTSMIRKAFFDIVDVSGCSVLDAFAGSGILGFEALSRGASYVLFVEGNRHLCEDIKANIAILSLSDRCKVVNADVQSFIPYLGRKGEKFDIVFLDPPFDFELSEEILRAVKDICGWLVALRRRKNVSEKEKISLSSIFGGFREVKKTYSDSVLYMFFSER